MEFLKALFKDGESITFEQLSQKIAENKLNIANLADGAYISKSKFDDKVNALNQQITDLQGQIAQRDTDMTDLNNKLVAAQSDATRLPEVQTALESLQRQYDAERQNWENKTAKQKYDFMVQEKAGTLKFTSAAAKRDFIREAKEKDFKIDGDILLGYEDFLTKYKADNPGALAEDKTDQGTPPPEIIIPSGTPPKPDETVFGFHFNGVRPNPAANNQ